MDTPLGRDTEVVGFTTNTRFDGTVDQKYVFCRSKVRLTAKGYVTERVLFWKTNKGNKRRVKPEQVHELPAEVLQNLNEDLLPEQTLARKERAEALEFKESQQQRARGVQIKRVAAARARAAAHARRQPCRQQQQQQQQHQQQRRRRW